MALGVFVCAMILVLGCGAPDASEETGDVRREGTVVVAAFAPTITVSDRIKIVSPRPGDTVSPEGFTVEGKAEADGLLVVRVLHGNTVTILRDSVKLRAGKGNTRRFSEKLTLDAPPGGPAFVEIYEIDTVTGKESGHVRVPVIVPGIAADDESTFYVYFTNRKLRTSNDCGEVYPVRRPVPATDRARILAAMYHLLQGPTEEESEQGYDSELPGHVRLDDVRIADSIVYVDFSSEMNELSGACSIKGARTQIEQTLAQIPGIVAVVISVSGRNESVLAQVW